MTRRFYDFAAILGLGLFAIVVTKGISMLLGLIWRTVDKLLA